MINVANVGSRTLRRCAVAGATVLGVLAVSGVALAAQAAAPTITVLSPQAQIYGPGSVVLADYSCTDALTCTGDVDSGLPIDTGTSGFKSFTVTATDTLGNITTETVSYVVSLASCVMPFDGLAAWLPGDGSATERIAGTPALWTGTEAYATGEVAQGFAVGAGASLSLPFQQAGPFTLQAWVRTPDPLQPEFTGVLSTGVPGLPDASLQIELDGLGNYRLNVGNSEMSWLIGPATNTFQHIAVTFDGATIAVYLNGQLAQSDVWLGSPALGLQILNVGIDRDGASPFTGVVDEVQVFDHALSDVDVYDTFLAAPFGLCKNQPPLAAADAATVAGNSGATPINVLANDTDPDGDVLQVTGVTAAAHGAVTFSATGVAYAPDAGYVGADSFSYTIGDGHGGSATAIVSVTVAGAPVERPRVLARRITADVPVGELYSYRLTATGSDPMTWSLDEAPAGMTIDPATGLVTWTPAADQLGPALAVVRVANSAGDSGAVIALRVVDRIAPQAPSGLSVVSISRERVTLAWAGASDNVRVAFYRIYDYVQGRTRPAEWRLVDDAERVRGLTAKVEDLAPGSMRTYAVTAVDTSGNESPRSAPITVTTAPRR